MGAVGKVVTAVAVGVVAAGAIIAKKISDKVGSRNSYNSNSASETVDLTALLNEFKTDVEDQSDELERQSVETASAQISEFISQIKQLNGTKIDGIPLEIDVIGLERRKEDQEKRINGYIKNHVQQRMSLADDECVEILKMDKGDAKAKAMDTFSKKVLQEGADELSAELKETINSMFEDVENTITERLNTIEETLNTRMENYNKMKSALDNNTQQEVVCLCYKNNAIYRHMLNTLNEKS